MGFTLMGRVVQSRRYRGTTRMILLLLAMRADDTTCECWPRIATIAEEANVTERAVQQAIRRLVADGALVREARYSTTGGNISNVWRVLAHNFDGVIIPNVPVSSPGGGEAAFTPPVKQRSPQGEAAFTPQGEAAFTPLKTSIENNLKTRGENHPLAPQAPAPAVVPPARGTPIGGADARESASQKLTEKAQRAEQKQRHAAIWRALADAGLPTPHSRREIAGQNAAIYSLMAAGATPDRIPPAVAAFHALWPKAICTVHALDNNWSLLMEGPKNATQIALEESRRRDEAARQRQRDADARAEAEHNSAEVQRLIRECLELPGPADIAAG